MFRERARTLQAISLTLDVICVCIAFGAALGLRVLHDSIPVLNAIPSTPWSEEVFVRADYGVLLGASLVAWLLSLRNSGVYYSHRSERFSTVLVTYLRAFAFAALATTAVTFVFKTTSISRIFFGYYFTLSLLLLCFKQGLVIILLRAIRQAGYNQRHALVVGGGKPALWFSHVLRDAGEAGYNLVGVLLTDKAAALESTDLPVVGTVEDIDRVLTNHPVDEVFVVGGADTIATLAPLAQDLVEKGRTVSLITPLASSNHGVRGRITEFSGVPMISFGPMPRDEVESSMRRVMDIAVAGLGLLVLAPVFATVSLLIKVFDPGPVFFSQVRVGKQGERFKLYKFRSMQIDAEGRLTADDKLYQRYLDNDCKLPEEEDSRISNLGRILRRTSLDELPQLWNILRGDMALVGPRPILPDQISDLGPYTDMLLSTRPGLTGHWQVSGRSDIQYPDRAFLDLDYIGHNTLRTDLSIIAKTVPAVVKRKGAF